MTQGEIEVLPEILFSQKTKKQFPRVLGFDLGSSVLSCSYSYSIDKKPATATVFQDWKDELKFKPLFPACIHYKNWSTTTSCNDIKVGFDGRPEKSLPEEGDFYIPSIKNYVIQWIQQGAQDNQPDPVRVLSDFFKAARTHFENAFNRFNEPEKPQEPKACDSKASNSKACDPKAVVADVQYYSLDDCRFSFAVPDSLACKSEYINIIREAFVQADFLKKDDDPNRLIFVTDAVAVGYSCVDAAPNFSGIELDTNYLAVDLGYDSAKFAIIKAQRTAATSTVLPSTHENTVAGYRSFNDNFRKYITERSDKFRLDINQPEEVDLFVDAFEKYKKSNIDLDNDTEKTEFIVNDEPVTISNKDLREYVFKPYLDDICSLIFKHCQEYRVAKIFLHGQYCEDPYFCKFCNDFVTDEQNNFHRIPVVVNWLEQPKHMVSNGAVAYGLRSASVQIPLFVPSQTPASQTDERINVEETKDSDTTSKTFSLVGLPENYFAIGIDFGTTFSGCSYAYIGEMKDGEKRTIETIDNWDKAFAYQKISTALRYNENTGKFSKLWGFDALKPQNPMKDGDRNLEYFKLLLSPENVDRFYGKGNREIQEIMADLSIASKENNKKKIKTVTPVDIIAEYLKNLNSRIKEYLHKKTGRKMKSMKFKYIITVPAMWTETGRATMIKAAIKAGLIKNEEDKSIQLITEPEAAALSCEKFMKETLKMNDKFYDERLVFTVFDAGGGTVDLVTFEQTTTEDKKKREIKQIGDGTGDTCGAAYLDIIFREAIADFYINTMGQRVTGEHFFNHHVNYFKENIKENFSGTSHSNNVYRIQLPPRPVIPLDTRAKPWRESTDPNRPRLKCRLVDKNTVLEIPVNEIQRCIFDPVVDKAVNVLGKHLENTSSGNRPSAVLMVGGFSQSKYLQQKIQKFCDKENIPHMSAPPEGVTAISRGAVSYFLEPRLVSRKIASSSYAICVDLTTKSNNASHLCYFIQKGDSIEIEEKLYTKTVSVTYPGSAVIALFAHDETIASRSDKREVKPYTTNDNKKIKKVAEYVIDLPESSSLSPNTKVDLQVSFKTTFDGISLDIKSTNDGMALQTGGQTTEEKGISFKRIKMAPLQVHSTPKNLFGSNLFGILVGR